MLLLLRAGRFRRPLIPILFRNFLKLQHYILKGLRMCMKTEDMETRHPVPTCTKIAEIANPTVVLQERSFDELHRILIYIVLLLGSIIIWLIFKPKKNNSIAKQNEDHGREQDMYLAIPAAPAEPKNDDNNNPPLQPADMYDGHYLPMRPILPAKKNDNGYVEMRPPVRAISNDLYAEIRYSNVAPAKPAPQPPALPRISSLPKANLASAPVAELEPLYEELRSSSQEELRVRHFSIWKMQTSQIRQLFCQPKFLNEELVPHPGFVVRTIIYPYELVVYGERVFISIVDEKDNPTPFTLTWLSTTASGRSPALNAFPSWRLHEKGNCASMQGIRGMVVDVCGRLWAVDNGNENCPAKIWIFDLTENDSVILVHQFANDIIKHTFGNSLKENFSWVIQVKNIPIHSIALSPTKGKELVYLGASVETKLYSVPLSELRMRGRKAPLTPTLVGNKKAGSFRMLVDNKGKLYFDLRYLSYIGTWDTTSGPLKEEQLYKDERLTFFAYRFSFTLDSCRNLWILSKDEKKTTNFRLLRAAVAAKSYLYNDIFTPKGKA
ncbi:Hypothetical predicted protein [Cloeon dipterum]|uniref:Uncharacterized protein n=1 Tax=Cloeon dipterum TaxID=197152 RepID=A0A8S1DN69_9INSE|nr:Hypothetical predicted protein [Cloeon dipterum]